MNQAIIQAVMEATKEVVQTMAVAAGPTKRNNGAAMATSMSARTNYYP